MNLGAIRWAAMGLFFLVGIPGMIVSSINDHTGAAVTFGLISAGAVLMLIAATAVVTGRIPPDATGPLRTADAEGEGAELEAGIQALVTAGADEAAVRDLVRQAVRLGRAAHERGQ
jgi:hypothetical protein